MTWWHDDMMTWWYDDMMTWWHDPMPFVSCIQATGLNAQIWMRSNPLAHLKMCFLKNCKRKKKLMKKPYVAQNVHTLFILYGNVPNVLYQDTHIHNFSAIHGNENSSVLLCLVAWSPAPLTAARLLGKAHSHNAVAVLQHLRAAIHSQRISQNQLTALLCP